MGDVGGRWKMRRVREFGKALVFSLGALGVAGAG